MRVVAFSWAYIQSISSFHIFQAVGPGLVSIGQSKVLQLGLENMMSSLPSFSISGRMYMPVWSVILDSKLTLR